MKKIAAGWLLKVVMAVILPAVAFAATPARPTYFRFTPAGGGGTSTTWQRVTDPCSVAVSSTATNASKVTVGPGGEIYVSGGCGLVRSTDGGQSWTDISDPSWAVLGSTQVDSVGFNDLDELVVGVGHDPNGFHRNLGAWRYSGGMWKQCVGLTSSTVGSDVADFTLDQTGALIAVTGDDEVWRSTDHGKSFQRTVTNLAGTVGSIPGDYGYLFYVALDPNTGYLYTGGEPHSGLFRSTDNGLTWGTDGLLDYNHGYNNNLGEIAVNRQGDLLVSRQGQGGELQRLPMGGVNWVPCPGLPGFVRGIVLNPSPLGTLYVSTDSGTGGMVFQSTTGGQTWTPFNNGLDTTKPVRGIAIGLDGTLYVLSKGTTLMLYRTTGPVR